MEKMRKEKRGAMFDPDSGNDSVRVTKLTQEMRRFLYDEANKKGLSVSAFIVLKIKRMMWYAEK